MASPAACRACFSTKVNLTLLVLQFLFVCYLGFAVVPFYPFWGKGSRTKLDNRKKGTLILTSLLEDLAILGPILFWAFEVQKFLEDGKTWVPRSAVRSQIPTCGGFSQLAPGQLTSRSSFQGNSP